MSKAPQGHEFARSLTMSPSQQAQLLMAAERLGETAGAMYMSKHVLDELPSELPDDPSPSDVVYRHIHDLRLLDSNPRLNLASYVTTWMEEPALKLIIESLMVNHADNAIYPSSTEIENKCVNIVAKLYNVPDKNDIMGCACIGSTEACLLGGLNLKKRWQTARAAKGLPADKPNIIICHTYQVAWKKLAVYFDIEMRLTHVSEGKYVLTAEDVEKLADENTIGVVAILGSTYTGHFDDIVSIDAMCEKLRTTKGYDLKIHVDAASGGMVAPFLDPDLVWDFRLKNVISINVSGHKYGLVYCGVGWAVWRGKEWIHPDMVFHLNYLGSQQTNLTLNFSRPASHIVASYYQFLRLGRLGYTMVVYNMRAIAIHLADSLIATGNFRVLNDPRKGCVPMVAFSLLPYQAEHIEGMPAINEKVAGDLRGYTEFELAEKLRSNGWSLPAYKMPPDIEDQLVCRAVIREDMSIAMVDKLIQDINQAIEWLDIHFARRSRKERDELLERTNSLIAPSKLKTISKMNVTC